MQLETIAQLGIFLILFVLGLEFSLAHLQRVWRDALQSALGQTVVLVIGIGFGSAVLPITAAEAIIVGVCCSLSSTAVVVTSLTVEDLDSADGQSIVGVLVMQDVLVGLLLAAVPLLLHPMSQIVAAVLLMARNLAIFLLTVAAFARIVSYASLR